MKNSKFNRVLVMLAGMAAVPVLGAQVTYLVTDLGTLGGGTATASAINTNSQVTGYSSTTAGGFDAYLVSNHAMLTMLNLGNLGGSSVGNALNNLGHVAGYSSTSGTTTT